MPRFKTKEARDRWVDSRMVPPTRVPKTQRNSDPLNESVRNVVDGWKLRDGGLCLYVRCEDNVTREIVLTIDSAAHLR